MVYEVQIHLAMIIFTLCRLTARIAAPLHNRDKQMHVSRIGMQATYHFSAAPPDGTLQLVIAKHKTRRRCWPALSARIPLSDKPFRLYQTSAYDG